jgi:hypothetical protein
MNPTTIRRRRSRGAPTTEQLAGLHDFVVRQTAATSDDGLGLRINWQRLDESEIEELVALQREGEAGGQGFELQKLGKRKASRWERLVAKGAGRPESFFDDQRAFAEIQQLIADAHVLTVKRPLRRREELSLFATLVAALGNGHFWIEHFIVMTTIVAQWVTGRPLAPQSGRRPRRRPARSSGQRQLRPGQRSQRSRGAARRLAAGAAAPRAVPLAHRRTGEQPVVDPTGQPPDRRARRARPEDEARRMNALGDIRVSRAIDGTIVVTRDPPHIRWRVGSAAEARVRDASAAKQRRRDHEERREIAGMINEALGGDIVIQARSDSGELRTFVSPPRTGDGRLDELLALAAVPVDFEPLNRPTPDPDRELEKALLASAAASERRHRQALIEERRRAAEEHFVKIEQTTHARDQAQSRREVFGRYFLARQRAAFRRRATKAARR